MKIVYFAIPWKDPVSIRKIIGDGDGFWIDPNKVGVGLIHEGNRAG